MEPFPDITIFQFDEFSKHYMPTCLGAGIQIGYESPVLTLEPRMYDVAIFGPLSPESAA